MRIRAVALMFAAIVAVSAALGFSAEEKKKKLLFLAPHFNIEGVGYKFDSLKEIGENLIRVVEEEMGLVFDYEMVGSSNDTPEEAHDKVLARLKKGGDFTWTDYRHYKEAQKMGIPILPLAIMTVGGKFAQKECLYVDKEKGFKKLQDLRDKNITGGYQLNWLGLRALLSENGIDERPDEFFKTLVPVKTYLASFKGIIGGYIDTLLMPESVFEVVKAGFPSSSRLVPLACTEGAYNSVFTVYRKDVDPEAVEKVKKIFYTVQNNPNLGMIAAVIKQLKISFVDATPEIMRKFEEEHQKAIKRGWFEEGEEYTETVKAMEKKGADIKKCRKNCEKKKESEKKICLDLCNQKAR